MIEAELPDGTILEFPDGTDKAVVQRVVKSRLGNAHPSLTPEQQMDRVTDPGTVLDRITGFAGGVARSIGHGLADPIRGGGQAVARGMEAVAPMLGDDIARAATANRENVENNVRTAEQEYQAMRADPSAVDPGRMIGSVATMAPFAVGAPATISGGVGVGALSGVMTPTDVAPDGSYLREKAKEVGIGAATGGAGTLATRGLATAISPRPEVAALMKDGATPTIGQTLGGFAQRLEEGATSIPILGDIIKSGQRRSLESFNKATINKALKPIGEKLNDATPIGREAVAEAGEKISAAYDRLLPSLNAKIDSQFSKDLTDLMALAKNLPGERSKQFEQVLTEQLGRKINPQTGMITGESLNEAQSALGRLGAKYRGSTDADQQLFGDALTEAQDTILRLAARANPEKAKELAQIKRAYAMQLRVEDAAGRLGSQDGIFTAAALKSATKRFDTSLRDRKFARGEALMQDYAENAQSVLGSKVPDSGTPFRLMATGPMTLGLGATAAAAPAMLAYTPLGQKLSAYALASRPDFAVPLAQSVRGASPLAAAGLQPLSSYVWDR